MTRFTEITIIASALICAVVHAQPATVPAQVPLCMIGDSITWAGEGDYWRLYLLEHLPSLAFVGTHSAVLGYSHAGEGGNSTHAVLARLNDIPDSPYYHLLIGTNDGRSPDPAKQDELARGCADRIVKIVQSLLAKPSVQRVFLGSILPCQTNDPNRDVTNSKVNAILRPQIGTLFPDGKVVWIEYEQPIRAMVNWGPMILLHPTKPGYQVVAKITADAIRAALKLPEAIAAPTVQPGAGVQVVNLWAGERTTQPIIAGWYTMSFDVQTVGAGGGTLLLTGAGEGDKQARLKFAVPADSAGKRLTWNLMTGYAGYGYTTGPLTMSLTDCTLDRILLEKRRPSGLASAYGTGTYLDTTTPIRPGEVVSR
ncbi:SGNH/GDSL hydrolase family protein [bacterium]|nr:SGNH/GDSL hydrolase family protein [bacterium]